MSRKQRRLQILAVVVSLLLAGGYLRRQLGIELSPDSLRAWVADLGWYGPAAFVTMLTFRQFLILPSQLVLTAGGLVFGVVAGTVLGTIGITMSAMVTFSLVRGLSRGRFARRLPATDTMAMANGVGAIGVGMVTAHPLGPLTVAHTGGALASMSPGAFLAAIAVGAPVRAFCFSYFGTSIVDAGSVPFYAATGLLLVVIVVPLLHTGTRRRIFATHSAGSAGLAQESDERSNAND